MSDEEQTPKQSRIRVTLHIQREERARARQAELYETDLEDFT